MGGGSGTRTGWGVLYVPLRFQRFGLYHLFGAHFRQNAYRGRGVFNLFWHTLTRTNTEATQIWPKRAGTLGSQIWPTWHLQGPLHAPRSAFVLIYALHTHTHSVSHIVTRTLKHTHTHTHTSPFSPSCTLASPPFASPPLTSQPPTHVPPRAYPPRAYPPRAYPPRATTLVLFHIYTPSGGLLETVSIFSSGSPPISDPHRE